MALVWNRKETPAELHSLLETLAAEYPIAEGGTGTALEFLPSPDERCLKVTHPSAALCRIEYGSLSGAARGLGHALGGGNADEDVFFTSFGILFDVSRAPVLTVKHFKYWLRRLALTGCNIAMLYTKDTYQLPGEPYFGYMRGAYSKEEIQEIDAYAKALNIEMVASIQALGHLEPILRWPAYRAVKDTDNVILVDEPKSYELVHKMLQFWSEALSSRRIHLGMDETHDLGRGGFLDKNGYERGWDIYNRHLGKVVELCKEFDYKPIIWSDMYFRFANPQQNYYDLTTQIPDDVKAAIPKEVQLSYWDYYHDDKEFYKTFLEKHRALGSEPFMASGIWTWVRLWYDHWTTLHNAGASIDGCRESGVREIIFTMWGDDGGYCEFDSAFAGVAWAADHACNPGNDDAKRVGRLFQGVCGSDYQRHLAVSEMEFTDRSDPDYNRHFHFTAALALWDDPLMGIIDREYLFFAPDFWEKVLERLRSVEKQVVPFEEDRNAGDFGYILRVIRTLIAKISFRIELRHAYQAKDSKRLLALAERAENELVSSVMELLQFYRRQWRRSYKSYGQEIMQIRMAGLAERYRETARTLREFVAGTVPAIDELENIVPGRGYCDSRYRMTATGGWFI